MEFQTLKKSHRKQIVIGALAICIVGGALTFATTRAKYKLTEELSLASGTINYKPYDFKIMAMYKSDDKTNYTEIDEMPTTGYVINESKTYCNMSNGSKDTTAVLKTINGNHTISKLKQNDRCYMWFDKKTPENVTELIASLNAKDSPTTFTGVATTDEGIYKVADGMYTGYSYYWRGAATTNHVIFANKCWRIVRINGDKTIRLIYNGTPSNGTCTGNGANSAAVIIGSTNAERYYATSDGQYNNSSYVGWTYTLGSQRPSNNATATASNAKTRTEAWFNNNSNFTDAQRAQVVEGKFCNERTTDAAPSSWGTGYVTTWSATGTKFAYTLAKRIYENRQPTLSCTAGDVYTLKVGAITADEVMFAGGWDAENKQYYLYTGKNYWTMSPYSWSGSYTQVFYVYSNGTIFTIYVGDNTVGLRPVINLNSNVTFNAEGNGTQNNPYVVQ